MTTLSIPSTASTGPAESLRAASLMIADVTLTRADGGWHADIALDELMVRIRAEQQGLADDTLEAAARCPRLRQVIAATIARVNAQLPDGQRVVGHTLLGA